MKPAVYVRKRELSTDQLQTVANVARLLMMPIPEVGTATPTTYVLDNDNPELKNITEAELRKPRRILTLGDAAAEYPIVSHKHWGRTEGYADPAEAKKEIGTVDGYMMQDLFDPLIAIASRFDKGAGPSFRGLFFSMPADLDPREMYSGHPMQTIMNRLSPLRNVASAAWLRVMRPLLASGGLGIHAQLRHTTSGLRKGHPELNAVTGPWATLTTPQVMATIMGTPKFRHHIAAAYVALRTVAEAFRMGSVATPEEATRVVQAFATLTKVAPGDSRAPFHTTQAVCVCGAQGDKEALRCFLHYPGKAYTTPCRAVGHLSDSLRYLVDTRTVHGPAMEYTPRPGSEDAFAALWEGAMKAYEVDFRGDMATMPAEQQPRGIVMPSIEQKLRRLVGNAWTNGARDFLKVHNVCAKWAHWYTPGVGVDDVNHMLTMHRPGGEEAFNRIARMTRAVAMEVGDCPTGALVYSVSVRRPAPGVEPVATYVNVGLKDPTAASTKLPGAPQPLGKRRRVVEMPGDALPGIPPAEFLEAEIMNRVSEEAAEAWDKIKADVAIIVGGGTPPLDSTTLPDVNNRRAYITGSVAAKAGLTAFDVLPKAAFYGHEALAAMTNDAAQTYRYCAVAAMLATTLMAPAKHAATLLFKPDSQWNPTQYVTADDGVVDVSRGPDNPCGFAGFQPPKTIMKALAAHGETVFTHCIPADVVGRHPAVASASPIALAAMAMDAVVTSAINGRFKLYCPLGVDPDFAMPDTAAVHHTIFTVMQRAPRVFGKAIEAAAADHNLPKSCLDARWLRSAEDTTSIAAIVTHLYRVDKRLEAPFASPALWWVPMVLRDIGTAWAEEPNAEAVASLFPRTRNCMFNWFSSPQVVKHYVANPTMGMEELCQQDAFIADAIKGIGWKGNVRPAGFTREELAVAKSRKPDRAIKMALEHIPDPDETKFIMSGRVMHEFMARISPFHGMSMPDGGPGPAPVPAALGPPPDRVVGWRQTPEPLENAEQPIDALRRAAAIRQADADALEEVSRVVSESIVRGVTMAWQPVFLSQFSVNNNKKFTKGLSDIKYVARVATHAPRANVTVLSYIRAALEFQKEYPRTGVERAGHDKLRNKLANAVIQRIIDWLVDNIHATNGTVPRNDTVKTDPRVETLEKTAKPAKLTPRELNKRAAQVAATFIADNEPWHKGMEEVRAVDQADGFIQRVCDALGNDEARVYFVRVPSSRHEINAARNAAERKLRRDRERAASLKEFAKETRLDACGPPAVVADEDADALPPVADEDADFMPDDDSFPGDEDIPTGDALAAERTRRAIAAAPMTDALRTVAIARAAVPGMFATSKRSASGVPSGVKSTATPASAGRVATAIDGLAANVAPSSNYKPMGMTAFKVATIMTPSPDEERNVLNTYSTRDTNVLRKQLAEYVRDGATGAERTRCIMPPKPDGPDNSDAVNMWALNVASDGLCARVRPPDIINTTVYAQEGGFLTRETAEPRTKPYTFSIPVGGKGEAFQEYGVHDAVLMAAGHPAATVPTDETVSVPTRKRRAEFNARAMKPKPTVCAYGTDHCVNWRHFTPDRCHTDINSWGLEARFKAMKKKCPPMVSTIEKFARSVRIIAAAKPKAVARAINDMEAAVQAGNQERGIEIAFLWRFANNYNPIRTDEATRDKLRGMDKRVATTTEPEWF